MKSVTRKIFKTYLMQNKLTYLFISKIYLEEKFYRKNWNIIERSISKVIWKCLNNA